MRCPNGCFRRRAWTSCSRLLAESPGVWPRHRRGLILHGTAVRGHLGVGWSPRGRLVTSASVGHLGVGWSPRRRSRRLVRLDATASRGAGEWQALRPFGCATGWPCFRVGRPASASCSLVPGRQLHVGVDHHVHELLERDLGLPAQELLGLACVAQQQVHLGGPVVPRHVSRHFGKGMGKGMGKGAEPCSLAAQRCASAWHPIGASRLALAYGHATGVA